MFIINFILQILPVAVNNCKPFRQKNQPLCFSCVLNVFCTIFKSDKIIILFHFEQGRKLWCTFDLWKMVCKWTLIQCNIYKFIVDSERKCITSQGKWERNWHILQWNWHMFLCDCFKTIEMRSSSLEFNSNLMNFYQYFRHWSKQKIYSQYMKDWRFLYKEKCDLLFWLVVTNNI